MSLGLLVGAVSTCVLDQTTKALVTRRFLVGQFTGTRLKIRHVRHGDQGFRLRGRALVLLWPTLLAFFCLVQQYTHLFQHPAAQLGIGAALGGAASNLYDHMRRGAVIDFIDLGRWPVFNLADVAITVGAGLALWFLR